MVDNLLSFEISREKERPKEAYKKVVLSIFKNHVDGLVLQNHFLESNDILMIYFFIQL